MHSITYNFLQQDNDSHASAPLFAFPYSDTQERGQINHKQFNIHAARLGRRAN